tara:strand:- start:228 stop:1223 length:996 start_codon:yes stop_codon:yes gene_type:complete
MKFNFKYLILLLLFTSYAQAAQYAVKYNSSTAKNEIWSVPDTGSATLVESFAFDSNSWSPSESYTDSITGVIYMLDTSDATYVTYDPATDTLTKNVTNGYVAGYQKLFPKIVPVDDIISNTTTSVAVAAATQIKTNNLLDSSGDTMIKVTADGATHIGKNSLVTIEQNGKQSLYATDASGNKIDIDVNNGSNLLINGVSVVDKINGSVAMGAALSSLPKSPDGTTTLCGLGAGYHDESIAISYGCSMDAKNFTSSKSRIFKNASLNFGSTIAYNKNNNFSQLAVSGGISWPLGKSSNNNIYSDKQESKIDSLNKEVAELRALIAEINSKLN